MARVDVIAVAGDEAVRAVQPNRCRIGQEARPLIKPLLSFDELVHEATPSELTAP
jgi:hypothetical protein